MRKNIHRKPRIGQLEQGAILNGCIAEEYADQEVYGIIITPRCDISNEKVTTFHYLPLVKYRDWLRVNFWELFRNNLRKNLMGSLGGMLKGKGKSANVLQYFSIQEVLEEFSKLFLNSKESLSFRSIAQDLIRLNITPNQNPEEEDFLYFYLKYDKITKNILDEVKKNRRNDFYLIEGFEEDEDMSYFLVLSREIRRITYDIGLKIAKGLNSGELTEHDYLRNDLFKKEAPIFISVVSVLDSPIIEHLIQHFNQNFNRIGITDHPDNIINHLFENC